jgi:hypothetical protein
MSDFRLVNTFSYHERTLFIAEWNEAYELDFFLGAIFFLKEAFLVAGNARILNSSIITWKILGI